MKKLLSLLFITVAAMLPKSVWAEVINDSNPRITIDGTTLTINSTSAGSLKNLMDAWKTKGEKTDEQQAADDALLTSMKECKTIVLEGKFQENDLQSIQNSEGFNAVTEVNMKEAKFVTPIGSASENAQYKLFKTETSGNANNGDRAIVGGTLYVSAKTPEWNSCSAPAEGTTVSALSNTTDIGEHVVGDFGKIHNEYKYIQMHIISSSWEGPSTTAKSNATDLSAYSETTGYLNSILDNYHDNESVWFYRYFISESYTEGNETKWRWNTTPTTQDAYEAATGSKYDNPYGVDLEQLDNSYAGAGNAMRVKVYYTKVVNREWINETTDVQTGAIDLSAYDFAYHDSHKTGYNPGSGWVWFNNNDWVKLSDYNYYQLLATGAWRWEPTTYTDGVSQYINKVYDDDAADNPNNANQYAIVGGTKYVYDGTWKTKDQVTEVSKYDQMKFSYWSNSLVTATTSRYADETISGEIFQNCKSITHINYLAGNVTGLHDRTTGENNFADFTVTIGKDVSKISGAAFSQSPALTGITFDKDYSSGKTIEGKTYPVELTIEDQAFKYCRNLFTVEIPNRCTFIGGNAFQEVGTGSVTQINNVGTQDYTFTLTFERRNAADESTVGINCNLPLTIESSAFIDCWYLKDLSLPIRLESMGDNCFKNSVSLKTLEMREETKANYTPAEGHDVLRTIPSGAFHGSAVEEVTIPKCVTLIENGAFGDTENLKKVVFQENKENPVKNLVIKSGAFTGGREEFRPNLDVYVMLNPAERRVICEYQAFNFTQTVGQTNTQGGFATLHFPEEYWDYYQGNWKRGLAFRQDNLNAFKDGYNRDNDVEPDYIGKANTNEVSISTETGKYETGTTATIYTPGNGWQEFARTSTTIDIIIPNTGDFLRTYSTSKPKAIPRYATDDSQQGVKAGDPFFKVYRINHFEDGYVSGSTETPTTTPVATAIEVKEHYTLDGEYSIQDNTAHAADNYANAYIPKNTGLLMAGYGNGAVNYIVYMADIKENTANPLKTYPWNRSQDIQEVSNPNLLYPTCVNDEHTTQKTIDGVEYVVLNPTYPYPYNSNTVPDYRFFGLAVRTVSDAKEYYFSRFIKNGKSTRDKAYLKLSNDVFHWTNEGPTASGSGLNNSSTSRVALNFFDDEEEQTTGIKQVNNALQRMDSNVFYTLEGVKLNSRPTQRGIYIHNGRKVVIK